MGLPHTWHKYASICASITALLAKFCLACALPGDPWFSEIALSVNYCLCLCFAKRVFGLVLKSLTAVAIAAHCIIEQSIPAFHLHVFSADT